jgi:LysR family hydrogen peroxide-inducible transcriptional activator
MGINPALDAKWVKRFTEPQPAGEVSLVVNKTSAWEQLLIELRKAILEVIPAGFKKNEG